MTGADAHRSGLSLFTDIGERKYLSAAERVRFLEFAARRDDPAQYTFCAMLHWTGCRPSEARAMTALHVDCDNAAVVIQSLKKRGRARRRHFRAVPVPEAFIALLEDVHDIRLSQSCSGQARTVRLWPLGRTTAWRLVREVMHQAGITGARACAKGLRHAYGVHAAMNQVPVTQIKVWLGHANIKSTEIYLDLASAENRTLAERMW